MSTNSDTAGTWRALFVAALSRELRTLARTRSVWMLAAGYFAITLAAAVYSGQSGYVLLVLALLTPTEILVPVLVVALAYRAILADRLRGELTVLETFPLTPGAYTAGVYCGRLAVALGIIAGTLTVTAVVVPLFQPDPSVLTRTGGLDSPVYYARFVALTAVFAAVLLSVTLVVSALARSARRGLVFAVTLLLVLVIGLDLAIVFGVARGVIRDFGLGFALAASPLSAYRGLVLTYAVAPAVTMPVDAASPTASVFSLLVWTTLSLFATAGLTGLD